MEKTISTRMYPLVILYDMHTKFFYSVTEGVSDNDTHNRLQTKANHIAWITGSLIEERFDLARSINPDRYKDHQAANELFKDHKGIQDNITYPSLDAYKKDWERITPVLREALVNITDERLDSRFDMEGMEMSYFDMISFMTYREANCIGQLALWRRLLGYEAMKYM